MGVQKKKAREILAVYAPLAESFGLWQIKNALEDLAFKYLEPERYIEVKSQIDSDPRLDGRFIEQRVADIQSELVGMNIGVGYQIGGYWEIAEKQKRLAMHANTWSNSFSAITDVISFRVSVDDESDLGDCYKAMGLMRLRYANQLMKRRHDDYLATAAVNGYSAIHDTYKFEEGNIEIAFTTKKRELFNNWGVVSLSARELKEGADKYKRKLIFTPKQELFFMELSATGIDVAYKLNPFLGLRAVGIRVDGRLMNLEEVVPNASLVEIIIDQNQTKPDKEWLRYCSLATRRLIEPQLAVVERDEVVEIGKKRLTEKALVERGILELSDLNVEILEKLLVDLGCWYGLSDLYYKVAFGLDMELVKQKMDEVGIMQGIYTTIQIKGENEVGIAEDVARTMAKYGGDGKTWTERVDETNRFVIRVLMVVGYQGKKKIEEELRKRYADCVVV